MFTVVITCHNQAAYIANAVESALAMTCVDREIVVIDDASSDRSIHALRRFGSSIRLLANTVNLGAAQSRNRGAAAAGGRYLVFLDGDDLFLPWALDVYRRIIERRHPEILLCRMEFFRGTAPVLRFEGFGPELKMAVYPSIAQKDRSYRGSASAIVVERRVFLTAGGYSDGVFPVECDDLLFKLFESGTTVHILSHPTVSYRLHESNTVRDVGRFLDGFLKLITIERRGGYPGGSALRLKRRCLMGGPIGFWVMRGVRTGERRKAARLLWSGWDMVLAAVVDRVAARLRPRSALESLAAPLACVGRSVEAL